MPSGNFTAHQQERVKESFLQYADAGMVETAVSKLFNVNNSNDYDRGYTTIEGADEVGYFDEQEHLKNIGLEEGYETTGSSREFGWEVTITKKERLKAKDETTIFNKVVDEKIPAATARMMSFIERQGHQLFNDGFAGATHLAPDGQPIFGVHTWNSSVATFDNGVTGVFAATALEALEAYGWAFTDAFGIEMPLTFNTLVAKTGGATSALIKKQLEENNGVGLQMVANTTANVNIYKGGRYNLIETPYITSGAAWFARATNQPNSFIMDFIQRPMMEEMILEKNLNQVFPTSASFRFGNYILPLDWYGSTGA